MVSAVLNQPTLVLNKNWQPVRVSTVARSLIMLWNGAAHVVDPEDYRLYTWQDWAEQVPASDEPIIQTVRSALRVPEVMVLTRCSRFPAEIVTFSRRNLFKRDRFTCQYCHCRLQSEELTIDHIIPRSQGGVSSWENCVLACVECNNRKADRTPAQAHMPLARKPVRPTWRELYSSHGLRIDSWSRFLSEAYWNITLEV